MQSIADLLSSSDDVLYSVALTTPGLVPEVVGSLSRLSSSQSARAAAAAAISIIIKRKPGCQEMHAARPAVVAALVGMLAPGAAAEAAQVQAAQPLGFYCSAGL